MSWVNLNDTYVNKTGDTIAGDLSVNGALNVNDGKGTETAYNVANEITALRDSTSKLSVNVNKITFSKSASGHYEIWFNTNTGDNVCIYFSTAEGIGVYDSNTQGGFNYPKP